MGAPEMADVEGRLFVGPKELRTTMLLDDGTLISFRAMNPTDEPGTRDLFYSLSQETVYYRYMSHMKRIPRKQLQNFVYVDHRNEVAIVGTLPEAWGEEIIAIGATTSIRRPTGRKWPSWCGTTGKTGDRDLHPQALGQYRQAQRHRRLHRRGAPGQQGHADCVQPQRPQGAEQVE